MKTMTFEQFLLTTVKSDKAYNLVEEHQVCKAYGEEARPALSEDSGYDRHFVEVLPLSVDALKEQYVKSQGLNKITGGDLDRIVEMATSAIRECYGTVDSLVDLGDNLYAAMDTSGETIKLKLISPNMGALILHAPNKHMLLEVRT